METDGRLHIQVPQSAREHTLYIWSLLEHSLLTWYVYAAASIKATETNKVQEFGRLWGAFAFTRFALIEGRALAESVFQIWFACMRTGEYFKGSVLLQQLLHRLLQRVEQGPVRIQATGAQLVLIYAELPLSHYRCVLGSESREKPS